MATFELLSLEEAPVRGSIAIERLESVARGLRRSEQGSGLAVACDQERSAYIVAFLGGERGEIVSLPARHLEHILHFGA